MSQGFTGKNFTFQRWDGLYHPIKNLSLSMSTFTTTYSWATGTSTNNLLTLTTDSSANGTGALLFVGTGTSSTVTPLLVKSGATTALTVNASAQVLIGTLSSGRVTYAGSSGLLQDSANMTFDGNRLSLATTGSSGGLLIGGDTNLYRSAADTLKTDDSFVVGANLSVLNAGTLSLYESGSVNFSSFAAGTQANDLRYTLPTSQPSTNQVLTATSVTGSGPYDISLGWVTNSASITIGDTVNSGTAGSVLFVGTGPVLAQDNANFYWDDTNNTFGVGTTRTGAISGTNPSVRIKGTGNTSGTSSFEIQDSSSNTLFFVRNDRRVGIGVNAPTAALDIDSPIDQIAKLGAGSITNVTIDNGSTIHAAASGTIITGTGEETGGLQINGDVGISLNTTATGLIYIYYDSGMRATFSDTNFTLYPYGTSAGNTYEIRLLELVANGSNYLAFKAPDNIGTTVTYTLPSDVPATGEFLKITSYSGGAASLEWAAATAAISIGDTVTSGTAGSILFVGSGPVLAQDNTNLFWDDTNNYLGLGTSATPTARLHVAGNQTAPAWTTDGILLRIGAATLTDSSSSGTVAANVANAIQTPTFAASSSTTYTDAATLYIAANPTAGTNVTITNGYALWVDSGTTRLDGNLIVGTLTSTRVPYASTGGLLVDSANMTFDGNRLALATTGNTGGLLIGGDTNLYRSAANTLKTDDSLVVVSNLTVNTLTNTRVPFAGSSGLLLDSSNFTYAAITGQLALATTGSGAGILIGGDTQLYRTSADVLRTPDSFQVDSYVGINSTPSTNNRLLAAHTTSSNVSGRTVQVSNDITGNITSAFPAAMYAQSTPNAGASTISYAAGIVGSIRSNSAQAGTVTEQYGIDFDNWHSGSANITIMQAARAFLTLRNTSSGTVTSMIGFGCTLDAQSGGTNSAVTTAVGFDFSASLAGASTIASLHGVRLQNPTGSQTITTFYGIRINDLTRGGTNYGIYFDGTSGLARQGVWWNGDTNLYRSAADTLKTDDAFVTASTLTGASSLTLGTNGGTIGSILLRGNTSGTVTVSPAAAAGTWTLTLPTTGGTNGYVLQTNGSGTTTWAAPGIAWTEVTGTSTSAVAHNGYVTNNAGLVTVTLPTPAVGSVVEIVGIGAGGWKAQCASGHTIRLGTVVSASTGYAASTNQYDSIRIVGISTTAWSIVSVVGTIDVV